MLAFWFQHVAEDLAPASGSGTEIDCGLDMGEEVEFLVEVQEFVGGAGAVACGFAFAVVDVSVVDGGFGGGHCFQGKWETRRVSRFAGCRWSDEWSGKRDDCLSRGTTAEPTESTCIATRRAYYSLFL